MKNGKFVIESPKPLFAYNFDVKSKNDLKNELISLDLELNTKISQIPLFSSIQLTTFSIFLFKTTL